jgi:hypothetical protein
MIHCDTTLRQNCVQIAVKNGIPNIEENGVQDIEFGVKQATG